MHAQRVMHARGPPLTLDARPVPAGPQNIALLVAAASEASGTLETEWHQIYLDTAARRSLLPGGLTRCCASGAN